MGSNAREKSTRSGRKSRHPAKPIAAPPAAAPPPDSAAAAVDPILTLTPNSNPNPNPSELDGSGWINYTEEQLEELLLKNLDLAYKEAISRLVSLGYSEDLVHQAILCNGHCYGSFDVLSNILQNAISFLNGPQPDSGCNCAARPAAAFSDLRRLEEYSLAGLVCLLQQLRPHLSRTEALRCLVMSDLHVSRAGAIDTKAPSPFRDPDDGGVAAMMKRLERMSIGDDADEESMAGENDHKKEMILGLIRQIQELEVQVKERRDWAHEKAMQAARKLSGDLTDLKILRMHREENQRASKGKQALDDATMKRMSEMEGLLKKASGQVDRANAAVRRLETENAEIRAEMEASKLSESESARKRLEAEKREKKTLKRASAWEKQEKKLQEEVTEERRKIAQMQQELNGVQEAQKKTELNWRKEGKAKELAISQMDEERRDKDAADASGKRRYEAYRQKVEIDTQRFRDDTQRLEEELSRLKAGSNPASSDALSSALNQEPAPRRVNRNRVCVKCSVDEVSVVLLPCCHQVLCAGCNELHDRSPTCPSCSAKIEQRIRVYGAN